MEEPNKLPLKRVELSLTKFNEVAIPHHLDLLRQHKANIIKYEENGDYARVRSEQTHARRVASQLRTLLRELESLRQQVRVEDRPRFDKLTQHSRDLTLKAIMDYLDTSPLAINRKCFENVAGSAVSTDSVGLVSHADPEEIQELDLPQIQLQVNEHELVLREREAVLKGWSELQSDIRALHDAWQHVQAAAMAQREQVMVTASQVEVTADNVQAARASLSAAERLKVGALGATGALVGALVGGPVGILVGAKAGAAALVAGSLVGFAGGRLLGRRRQAQLDAPQDDPKPAPSSQDKKDV